MQQRRPNRHSSRGSSVSVRRHGRGRLIVRCADSFLHEPLRKGIECEIGRLSAFDLFQEVAVSLQRLPCRVAAAAAATIGSAAGIALLVVAGDSRRRHRQSFAALKVVHNHEGRGAQAVARGLEPLRLEQPRDVASAQFCGCAARRKRLASQ